MFGLEYGSLGLILVVMLRILGFFVAAPFFSGKYFNTYIKIGVSIALAYVIVLINKNISLSVNVFDDTLAYAGICVVEVMKGLIIGFVATVLFNAIIFAGSLIDSQAGLTMATTYDPSSSSQLAVTANLYYYALIMVFLVTNMHHTFIKAISLSYEILPIGVFSITDDMMKYILEIMQDFLLLAFKFASPIIAAMLILDVGLGILVRAVPQMNVFVVGFPLKIAIYLFILVTGTNLFIENFAYIYDAATQAMVNIMRLLGAT